MTLNGNVEKNPSLVTIPEIERCRALRLPNLGALILLILQVLATMLTFIGGWRDKEDYVFT